MKKIMTTFLLVMIISSVANAGGSIGGGSGLTQEELALSLADNAIMLAPINVPDLGLERTAVDADVYRRTRARLSVRVDTAVTIDSQEIRFKSYKGGIVDLEEKSQLVIIK